MAATLRMNAFDLALTGDLILDYPDPDFWLSGIAPALRRTNAAIGHLEVPHTMRGRELKGDVPAPGADPKHIAALARAGFAAVSMAGNHIADCGAEGIADTIDELARAGIAYSGAGATLADAHAPAFVKVGNVNLALLSYNCVGPEQSWATETRAGCAYVRVDTADGSPITPSAALVAPDDESIASMQDDIANARRNADFIVVALHKGIVHTPAKLAPYERAVAHAAIDAGADVIAGHHAHIVRGIEFYQGKPIFHGLGNGCVVTKALSPDQSHPKRAEWARRRRELFGFEPDPAYELAPFHPEAVNAMLGIVRVKDNALRAGFIPVFVEPPGRPVVANDERARRIVEYIERIARAANLPPIRVNFDGACAWLS